MNEFLYDLNQIVKLKDSEEYGTVTSRAQYVASENGYLVRYKDATGCQVTRWWGESDLAAK